MANRLNKRVALATCTEYPELTQDDRLLLPELERVGIAATPCLWTDPSVPWRSFDGVVIRSTWDYFTRLTEYRAWLSSLRDQGVAVYNSVDTIFGNLDKTYLRALAQQGCAIVETEWFTREDRAGLASRVAALPWEDLVIKPSISAGAFRTHHVSRASLVANPSKIEEILAAPGAPSVLVQPFLREIVDAGEWSFLYFGDVFSHAVVKRPKSGDFRVQWRHGGSHAKAEPGAKLLAEVDGIFRALPKGRLFSRLDGVVVGGRFRVVEIELIEPFLFLAEDPASATRFASALAASMGE